MCTIRCLSAYVGSQGSKSISAASLDLARDCVKATVRTLWISTAWAWGTLAPARPRWVKTRARLSTLGHNILLLTLTLTLT